MDFTGQAVTFIMTIIMGGLLGVIFDFYRVLRGVFKPRTVTTYLFDLLYWLLAIILAFGGLLMTNWGELRFYVFLGLLGGTVLYYKLLSRFIIWCLIRLIRLIVFIAGWVNRLIVACVIKPVGFCGRMCLIPFAYVGRKTAGMQRRTASLIKSWLPASKEDPPKKE